MIKRNEYLANSWDNERGCSNEKAHQAYYGQFVNISIRSMVMHYIGKDRILASIDPYFNDIPLPHWDNLASWLIAEFGEWSLREQFKKANDFISLGGIVCVLKESARQIKEDYENRDAF